MTTKVVINTEISLFLRNDLTNVKSCHDSAIQVSWMALANHLHGSESIVIGAQQYTQKDGKGRAEVFANAIKHDFRSPSPTTRWGEIIKLNANAKKKRNNDRD